MYKTEGKVIRDRRPWDTCYVSTGNQTDQSDLEVTRLMYMYTEKISETYHLSTNFVIKITNSKASKPAYYLL